MNGIGDRTHPSIRFGAKDSESPVSSVGVWPDPSEVQPVAVILIDRALVTVAWTNFDVLVSETWATKEKVPTLVARPEITPPVDKVRPVATNL